MRNVLKRISFPFLLVFEIWSIFYSIVNFILKKLKMKILLEEKILKNRKIVFAYVSKHCTYFGTKRISPIFFRPLTTLYHTITEEK